MAKEESYWVAQPDCCDYCSELDGKTRSELDGQHPPAHPNCKCEWSEPVSASERGKHLTKLKTKSHSKSMPRLRAPIIQLAEGKDGKAPTRIQLMRVGTFMMSDGRKFSITPKVIKDVETNFKQKTRVSDIPIDYKHDNDDIAAAWIKSVAAEQDGTELWGEVDWTPNGERVVSEKEFRYFSPEFHPNYQDNEAGKRHGATLLGGGLTNRPIIKGMEPVVQLSEYAEPAPGSVKPGPSVPKEKTMLDPAAIDTMDIEELKAMCKQLAGQVQASEDAKKASDTAKMAAEAKCAELEGAKKMAEKQASFDKMLSEGKVVKAQEKPWLDGDVVKFAELAQPLNTTASGNGASGSGNAKVSTKADAEAEVIKLAEVKLTEKKARNKGDAISLVLAERKDLATLYNG